jgi:hypothetical protein
LYSTQASETAHTYIEREILMQGSPVVCLCLSVGVCVCVCDVSFFFFLSLRILVLLLCCVFSCFLSYVPPPPPVNSATVGLFRLCTSSSPSVYTPPSPLIRDSAPTIPNKIGVGADGGNLRRVAARALEQQKKRGESKDGEGGTSISP